MPEVDCLGCTSAVGQLVDGARLLGLALDATRQDAFIEYCRRLLEAGRTTNLTGMKTPDAVMHTLFLDSLTLTLALPDWTRSQPWSLVDVGSGAGIPGVPLKLAYPSMRLTLVESTSKKAAFLRELIAGLDLHGVSVENTRAEALGRLPGYRECADMATARAVAPLASLIELCAPLVRPEGLMLFPKSGDVASEIEAGQQAAGRLSSVLLAIIQVPETLGLGSKRSIVVYKRTGPVPTGYPRRTGLAQSRPIGT